MKWFIHAFKNIFNYKGRARRAEYGWFILTNFLLQITLSIVAIFTVILFGGLSLGDNGSIFSGTPNDAVFLILYIALNLYNLATSLVMLSLTTRRLHDLGWSGWWQLAPPLIIIVLSIITVVFESQQAGQMNGILILPLLLGIAFIGYLIFGLWLIFKDGQRFDNKYGPDPKATIGAERNAVNVLQAATSTQQNAKPSNQLVQ